MMINNKCKRATESFSVFSPQPHFSPNSTHVQQRLYSINMTDDMKELQRALIQCDIADNNTYNPTSPAVTVIVQDLDLEKKRVLDVVDIDPHEEQIKSLVKNALDGKINADKHILVAAPNKAWATSDQIALLRELVVMGITLVDDAGDDKIVMLAGKIKIVLKWCVASSRHFTVVDLTKDNDKHDKEEEEAEEADNGSSGSNTTSEHAADDSSVSSDEAADTVGEIKHLPAESPDSSFESVVRLTQELC